MLINIDFRLIEVSAELHALEEHLITIENTISHIEKSENEKLKARLTSEGLSPGDDDWEYAGQEYAHHIGITVPRMFRGPFLVSLYSVYESAVTEVARLIQKRLGQAIALNDLRGDFLDRAKKYFRNILDFELITHEGEWQNIVILSHLRNAIAHANGRMELLNPDLQKKISAICKSTAGVSVRDGYLVLEPVATEQFLRTIRSVLEDLVKRYKRWDDKLMSDESP